MGRKRLAWVLLVAAIVSALAFLLSRSPILSTRSAAGDGDAGKFEPRIPGTHTEHNTQAEPRADVHASIGSATPMPSHEARARRDALREQILRAQQNRPLPAAAPLPQAPADDDPDRPGGLIDRVGGREALVGHLNRDFMPLARECIALAQEETPGLTGMLALGVEVVADEKLGAVVDVAKAAPENQVHHPGLLECIRETALSVTLPPSLVTGRELFMLTLRVQPRAEDAPRR